MNDATTTTARHPSYGAGKHCRPRFNVAAKITAKFGGEVNLAKAIGIDRATAYRWQYARPAGLDGLIPTTMVDGILEAARRLGVALSPEDWMPERNSYAATAEDILG